MKKKIEKIKTLFEALPYIKSFYKKAVVIKYGGSAMAKDDLKESFARDVVLMKFIGLNPIIVHGGGPQISESLKRMGKKPEFVDGIRVTDDETMKVVEEELVENVNKEIVSLINNFDGKAVGLSGKESGLIRARPLKIRGRDMGRVGEVSSIKPSVIKGLYEGDFIPVIAPIGGGGGPRAKAKSFNINADTVAGNLAEALSAEKLILLTDVAGVLGKDKKLVNTLTLTGARELISNGVVEGGMVPKLKCCLHAVSSGVHTAHIVDGRVEHAVLLEIFTDAGCGTIIKSGRGKRLG